MSTYADLNQQPFSSLSIQDTAIVKAYGWRKCWPDGDYDFSNIGSRLLAVPDASAASYLRSLASEGPDLGEGAVDVRGAGPYGPHGEAILSRAAADYLRSLNLGLSPTRLTYLADYSVPRLAMELMRLDMGVDLHTARTYLYDGVTYGRVLFPAKLFSDHPIPPPPSLLTSAVLPPSASPAHHPALPAVAASPALPPIRNASQTRALSLSPRVPQPPKTVDYSPAPKSPQVTLGAATLSPAAIGPKTPKPASIPPAFLLTPKPATQDPVAPAVPSSVTREEFFEVSLSDAEIPVIAPPALQSGPASLAAATQPSPVYVQAQSNQPFNAPGYWQAYGRHSCGKILSGGTQGKIIACRDRLTGAEQILKWASCDNLGTPPASMLREIHCLRKCEHRNIIYLQAVLYDTSSIGLVLPRAACDLKTVIRDSGRQPIPLGTIKLYISQLLSGLAYLHDRVRLLHLDIKPENLLLNADHRLRIADFGLGRDAGPSGRQRTVVTMAYRAPEVFLRTGRFDWAVDMFASGVVLQEMLGNVPWAWYQHDPQQCFGFMLDTLGCEGGELWPGADELPGLWAGPDGEGDRPELLLKKGRTRFLARGGQPESLRPRLNSIEVQSLVDLRDALLVLDPRRRLRARDAYKHDTFGLHPKTAAFGSLPALQEKFRPPM
ncbi:hypothetical protein V8E36_004941 [Tilletia maclaganii]